MEKCIKSFILIYTYLIIELYMPFKNVINAPKIKNVNVQVLKEAGSVDGMAPLNGYTLTQTIGIKFYNYNRTIPYQLGINMASYSDKNIHSASRDNGNGGNIVTIEYKSVDENNFLSAYSQLKSESFSRGQAVNTGKKTAAKSNTVVITKNVKVEGGPGRYYRDMETLHKGTKVTVIGKEDVWYLVEYNGSKGKKRGYVHVSNIKASDISELKYNKTQGVTLWKTSVKGGPGADYAAIGTLKSSKGITILEEIGQWYFVEYNTTGDPNIGNKRGYVLKANIKAALSISNNLVDFVKRYEGYYTNTYICGGGKRTIGYGHVILEGETFSSITKAEARELLKKDLEYITHRVNELTWDLNLKQQEFDSLVSFAFNVGEGSLKKSDLLECIEDGERKPSNLRPNFSAWRKAGRRVLLGLERRRYDEWEMFCSGDYIRDAQKKYK
jgi:lysozyme